MSDNRFALSSNPYITLTGAKSVNASLGVILPTQTGANGTGGNDNTAMALATTDVLAQEDYVSDPFIWTGIYSGPELYIPPGEFGITSTFQLPARATSYGNITGAFETRHTARKNGYIHGLRCNGTFRSTVGSWGNHYDQIISDTGIHLDGYDPGYGTFYNHFTQCRANGDLVLDAAGPMTMNMFTGCTAHHLYLTPGVQPVHMNLFTGCEFSYDTGILNDGGQRNMLLHTYFDGGTEDIKGDWDVLGLLMGSAQGHPSLTRDNWCTHNSDVNPLTNVDLIPISERNLCSGNWDQINASGYPVGWTTNGGGVVITDATEPTGVGRGFGFTATTTADHEVIVPVSLIPQTSSVRISAVFFGTLTTAFIRANGDPATDQFASPVNFTAYGSGWYRATFNMSFNGGATSSLAIHFVVSGTVPSPKTLYLSSVQMGVEKALPAPHAVTNIVNYGVPTSGGYCLDVKGVRHQFGKVTQTNVAAPTTVDISITFPKTFVAVPASVTLSVEATGADTANMTKIWIKNGTLTTSGMTVTVTYATAFQGIIHWNAMGFSAV